MKKKNEAIVPPNHGGVLEPPKDDSNTQNQNSFAIYETTLFLREFGILTTLPIFMHLCWLVKLRVKLLVKISVA
jgi:hypothetical protein